MFTAIGICSALVLRWKSLSNRIHGRFARGHGEQRDSANPVNEITSRPARTLTTRLRDMARQIEATLGNDNSWRIVFEEGLRGFAARISTLTTSLKFLDKAFDVPMAARIRATTRTVEDVARDFHRFCESPLIETVEEISTVFGITVTRVDHTRTGF